jgi:hypothetical protein
MLMGVADPGKSTVTQLADLLVDAVRRRVDNEPGAGDRSPLAGLNVVLMPGVLVDDDRAAATFLPKLRRAFGDDKKRASGKSTLAVALSVEAGLVWAVGVLQVGGAAEQTVAVSVPVDREITEAFLSRRPRGGGVFVMSRLGTLPRGVLDVLPASGEASGQLFVLMPDALWRVRLDDSAATAPLPEASPPIVLPRKRAVRAPAGFLAEGPTPASLHVATNAGHRLIIDLSGRTAKDAGNDNITLKTFDGGKATVRLRNGSPTLIGPVTGRADVDMHALPARFRDLARVRGKTVGVNDAGILFALTAEGAVPLADEPVGDRIAVCDIDDDGTLDVATSMATADGQNDQLIVRRGVVPGGIEDDAVLFQSVLSGGAVSAMACDAFAAGGHRLIVVEETTAGSTAGSIVWQLDPGNGP